MQDSCTKLHVLLKLLMTQSSGIMSNLCMVLLKSYFGVKGAACKSKLFLLGQSSLLGVKGQQGFLFGCRWAVTVGEQTDFCPADG